MSKGKNITAEDLDVIVIAYKQGQSIPEIAKLIDKKPNSIHRPIQRLIKAGVLTKRKRVTQKDLIADMKRDIIK